MNQRVVNQVLHNDFEQTRCDWHLNANRGGECDVPAATDPAQFGRLNDREGDFARIDNAISDGEAASVEGGKQEHLIDQLAHAVDLVLNLRHELLALIVGIGKGQRLGEAENAR